MTIHQLLPLSNYKYRFAALTEALSAYAKHITKRIVHLKGCQMLQTSSKVWHTQIWNTGTSSRVNVGGDNYKR